MLQMSMLSATIMGGVKQETALYTNVSFNDSLNGSLNDSESNVKAHAGQGGAVRLPAQLQQGPMKNHRITEWFMLEGTIKVVKFQPPHSPPPPWADTSSTTPGCSKSHLTWL